MGKNIVQPARFKKLRRRAEKPVLARDVEISDMSLYEKLPTRFGRGMAVESGAPRFSSTMEISHACGVKPARTMRLSGFHTRKWFQRLSLILRTLTRGLEGLIRLVTPIFY
jgi:hypothetical protein